MYQIGIDVCVDLYSYCFICFESQFNDSVLVKNNQAMYCVSRDINESAMYMFLQQNGDEKKTTKKPHILTSLLADYR